MTTYSATVTVRLDRPIPGDHAVTAARAWAADVDLQLALTSVHDDRLAVMGAENAGAWFNPATLAEAAVEHLAGRLALAGHTVVEVLAVEVVAVDELTRRQAAAQAPPPLVDVDGLAALAGVTPTRIRQLEAARAAGERDDVPAPYVPGWWLRSTAAHWATTRKRTPGPLPRT